MAADPEGRLALLTGAAGGFGTPTIAALKAVGFQVRALVHRSDVVGADEEVRGDLHDPKSLPDAVGGAAVVIHLAGVTHARKKAGYRRGNVEATANLLEASTRASVSRFVYVSSRSAVAGSGAYGESKLLAERIVRSSGLEHVILRPAETLGTGSKEGIENVVGRARRGSPIPLVGSGADVVCPVHVDDVAAAIASAASRDLPAGPTYVLGGDCTTLRDFALHCRDVFGAGSHVFGIPEIWVRLAAAASKFLPLPIYPDQFERLRAEKPLPTPQARVDLGFDPRPLEAILASS